MCQNMMQLSPNVNPLDRRVRIKTSRNFKKKDKRQHLGRKRHPPERATFGARADNNVRSAGRRIGKYHKHEFSKTTCCSLSTKLKTDTVQTAFFIKRQLSERYEGANSLLPFTSPSLQSNVKIVCMRHEASDHPSFICHAACDEQTSIRK